MNRQVAMPALLQKALPLARTVLSRGLGAVSQLVLAWVVARQLPKSDAGEVLFYLTCFTVASPLVLLGTNQFAMRELSQFDRVTSATRTRSCDLIRVHGRAILISALLLLPIAVGMDLQWWGPASIDFFVGKGVLLATASLIAGVAIAVSGHLHGVRRLASSIFFSHSGIPTTTALIVVMLQPTTAKSVIQCHLAACATVAMIGITCWCWVIRPQSIPRFVPWATRVPRESFDFWWLNGCQLIMNWSPIVIAGYFLATSEIAEVNLAQRAANVMNFLLIVVSFTFAPTFRFLYAKGDFDGLQKTVTQCSNYLFAAGTLLLIVVLVTASTIMGSFGTDYRSGASILVVYVIGQYVNVITGSVNQILTMCDHERTLRNICFASATTSLILGLILTAWLGPIGVAVATAIALTTQNVFAVLAVRRLLGFWAFSFRPSPAVGTG
ncbi:MAG: polysaccharide biosynthesis C-terminal domain-containing protein [Planctomycetota bacterium]